MNLCSEGRTSPSRRWGDLHGDAYLARQGRDDCWARDLPVVLRDSDVEIGLVLNSLRSIHA